MRLKVDTTGVTFLLVRDAVQVRDWETKQAKANRDGVPLWQVQLVAMGDGEADIITVKVPGEPEGLTSGGPVTVEGLTVQPWTMGDRSGVSFRAEAIRDGARTHARANGAVTS